MDIGQLVRTIRKARGLTATQLAHRMGMSQSQILDLEVGHYNWTARTILLVARALGVRPFILLMSNSERRRAMLIFG